MSGLTLGDMAQSMLLQRRGVSLRTEMTKLSEELSTGYVADVRDVLAGNAGFLADIERDLQALGAYRIAGLEAEGFADAVQVSLDAIQSNTLELTTSILTATVTPTAASMSENAFEANQALEAMVAKLNDGFGGRSLFAGAATKSAALEAADTILATLEILIAGAATADDARLAAQTWFDDPGGFTAMMYTGSATSLSPFRVADGETVTVDVRADDAVIRDTIMNVALAALADSTTLSLNQGQRAELLMDSGLAMQAGQSDMTVLRAEVGNTQARIEQIETRNAAEETALKMARNDLLGVDPYETATKLEDVQFRLQSIYTLTARASDLKLVNFLR